MQKKYEKYMKKCINLANLSQGKVSPNPLVGAVVLDKSGQFAGCGRHEKYGEAHFVYAGGVMSNSIIRERLSGMFNCSFAEPDMSCDNAVGTAYLAYRSLLKQENL